MKNAIVRWIGPLALACGLMGAATELHAAPAPTPITAPAATAAAPSEPQQPVTDAIVQALDPSTVGPVTAADVPTSGARTALQILVLMTLLSLLPAIALTMTCFTRIIIVFSFLRQALGLPGAPPNQVLTGMAIFLTLFVMAPVFAEVNTVAIEPMQRGEITTAQALDRGSQPLAQFMLRHTSDEDLRMMYEISKRPRPATREEVSLIVLIPAYTLSEVRTAFTMGFLVLVPFLVIDLVVSSVLMAMGMVMLPPALITLPLKVLVFVLADGWGLVIQSLVRSLTG
jgi:flagellar biosynthetic protein FliP